MNDRFERPAGRTFDAGELEELMRDGRVEMVVRLGLVVKPEGEEHFEIHEKVGPLVQVMLLPGREVVTCRLGSAAGGAGIGVWRIPPVDTEVIVVVPGGDLQGGGWIIAAGSSGTNPADLDGDVMFVVGKKLVHVKSIEEHVKVDSGSNKDVIVNGGSAKGAAHGDGVSKSADFITWAEAVRAQIVVGGGGNVGDPPTTIGTINVTANRRFKV